MKVLVLGAGLTGTTTAYFLARAGCDVTVVDRASAPASEGSYANAGLIHASLVEPWNSPQAVLELLKSLATKDGTLLLNARELPNLMLWGIRFLYHGLSGPREANTRLNAGLAVYSQQMLAHIRDETGIEYDNTRHGMLKLFQSRARLETVLKTSRLLEPYGIPHEQLDVDEIIRREPLLEPTRDQLAGAVLYPNDERGCPRYFTRRLAAVAEDLGAQFIYDTRIDALHRKSDRIERVATSRGDMTADLILLAAGPEAAGLARKVGLRLPIRPVKGYSTTLPVTPDLPVPTLPLSDDARKLTINRLGDRLRISGTAEFAGYDRTVRQDRIRQVLDRACETLPALADHVYKADQEPWACLRPMTADGPALLGATPISNLYLNAGPGHLGWTMAAGSARLVADVMLGNKPALPMEGFSVQRYRY
ncbi:D-amino-acid dehydrogenase [Natronocella acetinitrilica]|uniref:D-amino-acid dehydrogenase n=1 Tax=Natronocella acetinitrilica TaxID=414046 RepID=A0AAE3G699_9GAMM|nr:FAD-dependent oxidoreductase [Natronocella acetinitrilica]MCP1676464.1 D-amino-acid dehydrogenase [Natronocella acetinitrilica]